MCGRYGGPKDQAVYAGYLPVNNPFQDIDLKEEYSIGHKAPVFARSRSGTVVAQEMRFGLIPSTFNGAIRDWGYSTWNARLETVGRNQSFATAWNKGRRAIVPAPWVAEYLHVIDVPTGRLQADFCRADDKPMGLAAVWDYAQTADGPLLSFALITRQPGPKMMKCHPREICVVEPEDWNGYLHGEPGIDLARPWADDAWMMVLPLASQKRMAQAPHDLFAPSTAA